ncbi:MAG TPA: anti-sigma factor, partial [Solirubrobacterales bacterium]|nr:anti-sigma factor [Solirubrobacterales bacterium]
IDREIAVSYLLGELSAEDREQFEARLVREPELAATVAGLEPVVSQLEAVPADVWDPPEPPPLDLARVTGNSSLADRESEFTSAARDAKPRSPRPWTRILGFVAAGAALLLVGFFIGNRSGESDSPAPPSGVGPSLALDRLGEAPQDAHGQVQMVSSEGDQMRLEVSGLKPSHRGDFYEAWLLGKDGELVALGSFKVGKEGKKSIELPLPANPASFRYFDVSIQPDNGSPDHSGRSVLRGLTTY